MKRLMSLFVLSSMVGCWSGRDLAVASSGQPLAEGEDERLVACARLAAQMPITACSADPATVAAGGPDGSKPSLFYQAYCGELPPVPEIGTPPMPLLCIGSNGPDQPWIPSIACRAKSAAMLSCIADKHSCNPAVDCADVYLGAGCDPTIPAENGAFLKSCVGTADNLTAVSTEPHSGPKDPLYGKYGFSIDNCNGHSYQALCTLSPQCDFFDCECRFDGNVTGQGHVIMSAQADYPELIAEACGW